MSTRTYAVFISYRHADNKAIGRQWATWLHHSLETYEVPPELVGRPNQRREPVPHSLFPVFRDEEELPADADLSVNIRRALERSGLLVVICSPRAVLSQFVDDEIRHFKELGRSDRILALLIDGEPNARDAAVECLPKSLRYGKPRGDGTIDWDARTEPIAADVRPEGQAVQGWTTAGAYEQALEEEDKLPGRQIAHLTREYERRLEQAKLKVIAGALGVDLGELTKRDQSFELAKARRRARVLTAWLTAVTILGIAAAAAGVIAFRNQREAERQTKVATEQRDRALREAYVNVVRRAGEQVTAGRFGEAREILFRAPPALRAWEWWYLMARCGPAPMTLTEFAALDARTASAMKVRLDRSEAAELQRGNRRIELRLVSKLGRTGAWWHARRVAGYSNLEITSDNLTSIVLNAFSTGMYGEVSGIVLDADAVFWRTAGGDPARHRPPVMATGEELADNADYVAFLRERYIVGGVETDFIHDNFGIDLTTWSDAGLKAQRAEGHYLSLETAGPNGVAISDDEGYSFILDLKTSMLTDGPIPDEPESDDENIRNRLLARFERVPDVDMDELPRPSFVVSPDGREAALAVDRRTQRYLAAWNVKSGKLVYGPFSIGIGEKDTPEPPPDYAWHPKGNFVAIRHASGTTELRRTFASAPFARLEGIDLTDGVRETGDPTRVLIGNWVVDPARLDPVLALPQLWLSPDGNRAVIVSRPGVIEIVRPGFRHAPASRREAAILQQIRAHDRSGVTK